MKFARIPFFWLICLFASCGALAQLPESPPDEICQRLFQSYIIRPGGLMVFGDYPPDVAAAVIISERGGTGFWKIVLKELQKGNTESEKGCVRVLGMMLAIDAGARDAIKRDSETEEIRQTFLGTYVGPEVVEELLKRGKEAVGARVDYYAIALMRARMPEATDFFRMILRDDTHKSYQEGTKFHAAVGLAQLGEPDGFEWLIKNTHGQLPNEALPMVENAWPDCISERSLYPTLNVCSIAALQELSGEKNLTAKQDWESWWLKVNKKALPKNRVIMNDR